MAEPAATAPRRGGPGLAARGVVGRARVGWLVGGVVVFFRFFGGVCFGFGSFFFFGAVGRWCSAFFVGCRFGAFVGGCWLVGGFGRSWFGFGFGLGVVGRFGGVAACARFAGLGRAVAVRGRLRVSVALSLGVGRLVRFVSFGGGRALVAFSGGAFGGFGGSAAVLGLVAFVFSVFFFALAGVGRSGSCRRFRRFGARWAVGLGSFGVGVCVGSVGSLFGACGLVVVVLRGG